MQAYSKEYRRDVLAACDGGEGTQAVALRFGCSESWVRRIKQVRREEHRVTAKLTRQRTPKWAPLEGAIRQAIAETPDLTLSELKAELGTKLDESTLCRALKALRLTLKKKS